MIRDDKQTQSFRGVNDYLFICIIVIFFCINFQFLRQQCLWHILCNFIYQQAAVWFVVVPFAATFAPEIPYVQLLSCCQRLHLKRTWKYATCIRWLTQFGSYVLASMMSQLFLHTFVLTHNLVAVYVPSLDACTWTLPPLLRRICLEDIQRNMELKRSFIFRQSLGLSLDNTTQAKQKGINMFLNLLISDTSLFP